MEVDPLTFHPLMPERVNSTSRKTPKRNTSARSQKLSMKASTLREARLKRTPSQPLGRDKDADKASKPTVVRPLAPVPEKRSGEDGRPGKTKKEVEVETWDITPDGGSASREGRQFRVANVGNNGKIYLRPTVRPANQRFPQPHFVFPAKPAEVDAVKNAKAKEGEKSELQGSQWTSITAPSTPAVVEQLPQSPKSPTQPSRHRRAVSDSTVREGSIAHESEAGGFKVVITKPYDDSRPKTTENVEHKVPPMLQISIPTWKLGTPRFTVQGTPIIQASSYAPTEDNCSSKHSFMPRSQRGELNSLHQESLPARHSPIIPHIRFPSPEPDLLSPLSPRFPGMPARSTYLSTHLVIEPAMFDALTFKPDCDDRLIVRYFPSTGAVTAATPPRLVAEITSPSFLDYELLSDFFLTFRAFLDTTDLLKMLVARLRWALSRDDETGMVVRVRTFVAIRHWILNYFVDDFVVDYPLRVSFCNLLNDFVEELSGDPRGRKVQLKILAELKKCWRRVGAQYWDGPEFDSELGVDIPIAPGGIAGHRNPALDPGFWESDPTAPPQLYDLEFAEPGTHVDTSFYNDVDRAGRVDTEISGERPRTPEARPVKDAERQRASSTSLASLDVVSCSFPTKGMRMADADTSHALTAHPADPSSLYNTTDPIASTPRALSGKRVRAQTSHKRNNSLTDSIREHTTITEKVIYKNAEFLLTLPYAGSLVRGNLLPPGQAFVKINPPNSPSRDTTVFQPYPTSCSKEKPGASAMSGAGMKKLLNGVRKALRSRGQGVSPTQGNFLNMAPIGPRGVTENRLPGTAVVPQARPRHPSGFQSGVRIDILGAEIAEDFKKAVREDAAEGSSNDDVPTKMTGDIIEYSAAHLDSSLDLPSNLRLRPDSDAALTTGSKSIVIVDGTLPTDLPVMAGALPVIHSSVDDFTESFLHRPADPTPPNTPPGRVGGNTPRRSSFTLDPQVMSPAQFASKAAHFIPDLGTGLSEDVEDTNPATQSPINQVAQSPNRPPLSNMRYHKRQQSSRSFRSKGSASHRRWASVNSIVPPSTVRSFDATSYSEGSVASEIVPPPLRVLRRRPGGDLRGVQNVADLHQPNLHRSRSTGSLTTCSDSLRSSYLRSPLRDSSEFVDVVSSDYSQHRNVFSLGAMAASAPKRQLSLFSTHSSKPLMRPSFEAEAQKLARIPDDMDDDGGVESALAKLEGKFEKRSLSLSLEPRDHSAEARADSVHSTPEKEKRRYRHQHIGEDAVLPISSAHQATRSNASVQHVPLSSELKDALSQDQRESYSSVPLLNRGLTDDGRSQTQSIAESPSGVAAPHEGTPDITSPVHQSYEFIKKTESLNAIPPGETMPKAFGNDTTHYIESDDSDLSTEISVDAADTDEFGVKPTSAARKPSAINTEIPMHVQTGALGLSETEPPSPPITFRQALKMSPESSHVPRLHEYQVWGVKPLPPTPDTTPTTAMHQHGSSFEEDGGNKEAIASKSEEIPTKFTVHLPFILAFDSEVLAQQFTLIEKDALNEIDWKELIDMRWKNSHTDSRSWVDFLRNSDARGVEVVVARFNIMVKWAISEIVLCKDIEERARCIIKFIHIAAHCRTYRNFATMNQIAIALTVNEIGRLTKTWAMVPPNDIKTLQELEILVSPTKNFYNLRAEMEGGATAADTACIPFVGIYTHDLLFNAQRPSEIASSPTTAPLVNFERCRIAASVVKTLLRLLEASTLYDFQPIEGITERCLWMSALSDDEIRKHAENLEPQHA